MKNKRKPTMLRMNNAFILIFGSTLPPASYLSTKRNAAKIPKSVNFFSGADPVARQKSFEKNIHLCITAFEYIMGHISMLLKGAWIELEDPIKVCELLYYHSWLNQNCLYVNRFNCLQNLHNTINRMGLTREGGIRIFSLIMIHRCSFNK